MWTDECGECFLLDFSVAVVWVAVKEIKDFIGFSSDVANVMLPCQV